MAVEDVDGTVDLLDDVDWVVAVLLDGGVLDALVVVERDVLEVLGEDVDREVLELLGEVLELAVVELLAERVEVAAVDEPDPQPGAVNVVALATWAERLPLADEAVEGDEAEAEPVLEDGATVADAAEVVAVVDGDGDGTLEVEQELDVVNVAVQAAVVIVVVEVAVELPGEVDCVVGVLLDVDVRGVLAVVDRDVLELPDEDEALDDVDDPPPQPDALKVVALAAWAGTVAVAADVDVLAVAATVDAADVVPVVDGAVVVVLDVEHAFGIVQLQG